MLRGARAAFSPRHWPLGQLRGGAPLVYPVSFPLLNDSRMNDLLRSFARALANAFHPRMLWLTFMPFVVATAGWGILLWFFWQTLTGAASGWLDGWAFTSTLYRLFDSVGFSSLHAVIAPFLVVVMSIPLIVVTVLLLIATMSMPSVIKLLMRRQYATLETRRGGSWYGSLGHSVVTTVVCLVLLVVTLPLWLIPLRFALIPPLLWGAGSRIAS